MTRLDWRKAKAANTSGAKKRSPSELKRSEVRGGLNALAWITEELKRRAKAGQKVRGR